MHCILQQASTEGARSSTQAASGEPQVTSAAVHRGCNNKGGHAPSQPGASTAAAAHGEMSAGSSDQQPSITMTYTSSCFTMLQFLSELINYTYK